MNHTGLAYASNKLCTSWICWYSVLEIIIQANSWRWQGVSAKAYNLLRNRNKGFQTLTSLILYIMNVNPPGGVNLTLAIFALVGAFLSIVGFFAHYIPRHQYGVFCGIVNDIYNVFADEDWQLVLPSDQRSQLILRYCRHVLHALLTPSCIGWCIWRWHLTKYLRKRGIAILSGLKAIIRISLLLQDSSETAKSQKKCSAAEIWTNRECTFSPHFMWTARG